MYILCACLPIYSVYVCIWVYMSMYTGCMITYLCISEHCLLGSCVHGLVDAYRSASVRPSVRLSHDWCRTADVGALICSEARLAPIGTSPYHISGLILLLASLDVYCVTESLYSPLCSWLMVSSSSFYTHSYLYIVYICILHDLLFVFNSYFFYVLWNILLSN